MFFPSLVAATLLGRVVSARVAECTTSSYVLPVEVESVDLPIPEPQSQAELTGSLVPSLAPTAAHPSFPMKNSSFSASISAIYCVPENWDNSTVNLALHGLGFDKTYWDIQENGTFYSFAEAAAMRGEATFAYDRLGVGASVLENGSYPDAINQVQLPINIAVAGAVAGFVRETIQPKTLIGVGHSYGSLTLLYLASLAPTAVDHLVLTGFSADPASYAGSTAIALNVAIANEAYPERFANRSNSYLVTGNAIADQTTFMALGGFDSMMLNWTTENKGTLAYGELLTFGPPTVNATDFGGAVLAISGDQDFIFCASNCTKTMTGYEGTPIEAVTTFFPSSPNFTATVVPATGHGLNVHMSAPDTYAIIGEWNKMLSSVNITTGSASGSEEGGDSEDGGDGATLVSSSLFAVGLVAVSAVMSLL